MSPVITSQFWSALAKSPFLMVSLDGKGDHSIPMTAQLDPEASSCFWFYTTSDNRIAAGGKAMAQFVSKAHDLFACIAGVLVAEKDPAVIERHWSRQVGAWYSGGKEDPNLLMLRFDLTEAELWTADLSLIGRFKLLTGFPLDTADIGSHATVAL